MMKIRVCMASLMGSLLLLAGCAAIDLETDYVFDPALIARAVDQDSDRFPRIDPLHLDNEVKLWLEERLGDKRRGTEFLVSALQDLMYDPDHLHIRYSDAKTHTATEVFHAREGNCLSVMNLYVAMARHLGLDASFQTVEVQPSWDRRGDLLVVSQHINATGRLGPKRYYVVDFTPEIALQSMTESAISDDKARALYFNNLGVEALVAGDDAAALAYIQNALFIDPANSNAWNNLGTAYKRLGDGELAEFAYHYAFEQDNTNATAVNNLVKFYRGRGDDALARRYERVIDDFNQRNPFFHYGRGSRALEAGNFEAARAYFRRAIRLKEYEPDFHLGLAMAYARLGEIERARDARDAAENLLAASEEIYVPSDRRLRIFDRDSILRTSSPGLSIRLRGDVIVEPGGRL